MHQDGRAELWEPGSQMTSWNYHPVLDCRSSLAAILLMSLLCLCVCGGDGGVCDILFFSAESNYNQENGLLGFVSGATGQTGLANF